MRINKKILFLSVALMCAASAGVVHAATLTLISDKAAASINEPVRFALTLDTQGDDVNAVQATISFDSARFAVASVSDADSVINFWVGAPGETAPGRITFSGIMPGGYRGATGTIVSFVLLPRVSGSAAVGMTSTTVLLNDGEGTAAPVKTAGKTIAVGSSEYVGPSSASASASASASSVSPDANSTSAPESFTPLIGRDSDIFDGKYFVAFSAADKSSGIDHYEVLEVPAGTSLGPNPALSPGWQDATSPHMLADQNLASDVYVKAINHAGNATVGKLPAPFPPNRNRLMQIYLLIGGILVLLLVAWMIRRRRARPRH